MGVGEREEEGVLGSGLEEVLQICLLGLLGLCLLGV